MKAKTEIFANYGAFLARSEKNTNGVTQEFADAHPNFFQDNETNKGCWRCSRCSDCSDCSDCSRCSYCSDCSRCSGCSDCSYCSDCSGCSRCSRCSRCSDCSRCSYCSDCSRCSGCSGCSDCSDCSDCSRCSRCSDCSYCSDCSGCSRCSRCSDCSDCSRLKNARPVAQPEAEKSWFDIPVISNIHQTILKTVENPNALNMATWHTCETTHCRAGWVVLLAGERGRALELASSTLFAAMQIYHASNPAIPVSPVRFFETNEVALADIRRCAELEKNAS